MFDRLVCMNGGNPREELIDHKNPEKAMRLERSPEWEELSLKHLEGRTAGFFRYGDGGGDELDASGRPKNLRHPEWFDPEEELFEDMRQTYAPLVWQCRYSGIVVPGALWRYVELGRGRKYSENQAEHMPEQDVWAPFDAWTDAFAVFVRQKGKVPPGRYRAFGYEPPKHRFADAKLGWREARMRLGHPPKGSSPAAQQELSLNQDVTLRPAACERGGGEAERGVMAPSLAIVVPTLRSGGSRDLPRRSPASGGGVPGHPGGRREFGRDPGDRRPLSRSP